MYELSPSFYRWLVRPHFITKHYIHNVVKNNFDLRNKTVLDFGSGVGSNCSIVPPHQYFGLDIDAARIAYSKRMYPEYNFNVIEGEKLPVPSQAVDYVLIIAVLHHIPPDSISGYLQDFHRVLKPGGKVIAIEPCLFDHCMFSNRFMTFMDKGKYIRSEDGYRQLFQENNYQIRTVKKFKKMFFYNELLFWASPASPNRTDA